MRWDLFCTVVDNYGDIGFCWRLARQLSSEYQLSVRLWVDDLNRLACLCPEISVQAERQSIGSIEIRHWTPEMQAVDVADVVIEAFACRLPESYIQAMSQMERSPVWINLEYLSAEPWVEGCHLLPSSQSRSSLKKSFFFPGFTDKTGGLLRERGLLDERREFNRDAQADFWSKLGLQEIAADEESLLVSLFCYENTQLTEIVDYWSAQPRPVRLLATYGFATEQIGQWFERNLQPGQMLRRGSLTVHALPFLSQPDYDRLLWACHVNFVRGEDSFVRAQWAQRPFVWQIYTQSESAHFVKLDAFLDRYLVQFDGAEQVRQFWRAWNGVGEIGIAWQHFAAILPQIEQHGKVWATELDQVGNLADNLVRFVCGE